jgi:protein-tyrosine-phosphatase
MADPASVPGKTAPGAVLFVCGMNAIRSPMAEVIARSLLPPGTYVASAGVRPGEARSLCRHGSRRDRP